MILSKFNRNTHVCVYIFFMCVCVFIYIYILKSPYKIYKGFPCGSAGKESAAMQETWVPSLGWEIPWRREKLLTPVVWPGEFQGLYSLWGCKKSHTNRRLSLYI